MDRTTLTRRIAARRKLVAMAESLSLFYDRPSVERMLRERAPGLVHAVGEREMRAVLEIASRPLHAS